MNALSLIDDRAPLRRDQRVLRMLAVALIPAQAVFAVAVLLVWRRSVGALTTPPSTAVAAVFAPALLGLDAVRRIGLRRTPGDHDVALPGPWRLLWNLAPIVQWGGLVAIAAALTLPGTKPAGIALLWAPVIVSTALSIYHRFAAPRGRPPVAPRLTKHESPGVSVRRLREQTTRYIDAAGRDVIEGTAVAEFAPGQRIVSLHLAFCPPFDRTPEIACGVASETAAEVKVVQILAYAARFDVKLSSVAAARQEVAVSFSARCDG